jgi:MFS family permease
VTSTLAGFSKNFAGFLVTRIFVGVFEAGIYPGMLFLIGSWYTRQQVGARMAWFMVANDIAGSISGLLGAGLGSLDGVHGYSGWSWIYFIEGAMTCFAAVLAFFFMLSFPKDSTAFKPEEKELLLRRLAIDNQRYEEESKMSWTDVGKSLLNWRLISMAFLFLAVCNTSYSLTVFQPTILNTFGWSSLKSNLLSSPVRIASGIVSVCLATWSNRINRRGIFIMAGFVVSILGLFFVMLSHNYRLRYMGLYLGAIGIYIAQPLVMAWG